MLLELLAMAAILVAAWPLRPAGDEEAERRSLRWLLGGAAGFVAAPSSRSSASILLTGPSPADVYDGVVTQALRVRDVLVTPLPIFPPSAVDWAIAAVAAASWRSRLRLGGGGTPRSGRACCGPPPGWRSSSSSPASSPLALNPAAGNPDALPMLLAWVAAIPPGGAARAALQALPADPAAGAGDRRDAAGLPGGGQPDGDRRAHLRPGRRRSAWPTR